MKRLADRSLHWLSDNALERQNITWRIVGGLVSGIGTAFCVGPVQQGYLLKVGFSDSNLGQLAFVGSIVYTAGLFVFVGMADRFRRRIPTLAALTMLGAAPPLTLCLLSLIPRGGPSVALVLYTMSVVAAIQQSFSSLGTMVGTGVIQRTLRVFIRGRVGSIEGFIGGVAGMLAGVVAGRVLLHYAYPLGYTVCFAIGAVFLFVAALLIWKLSELPELDRPIRLRPALPRAILSPAGCTGTVFNGEEVTMSLMTLRAENVALPPTAA